MSHDEGQSCVCVTEHRPKPNELHGHHVWPLSEGGPDDPAALLWVCPTIHTNIHELWRLYKRYGGRPPWAELQYYSPYCRQVVADGWEQMLAAQPPSP